MQIKQTHIHTIYKNDPFTTKRGSSVCVCVCVCVYVCVCVRTYLSTYLLDNKGEVIVCLQKME